MIIKYIINDRPGIWKTNSQNNKKSPARLSLVLQSFFISLMETLIKLLFNLISVFQALPMQKRQDVILSNESDSMNRAPGWEV
ncbi:MAG: hypothetical protein EGR19_02355 [Dialister sp.]|nr:hypothetical protein [Dialister sp.]